MLSVSDILANSSDVGAIKIALRLGNDRFYKYIRGFGFGHERGSNCLTRPVDWRKPASDWSKVSIGAISMGQEIGVTPDSAVRRWFQQLPMMAFGSHRESLQG